MALTRQGGYIQASTPVVTFLNGKGLWSRNQINQFQSTRVWPQEFSTVLHIAQGSSTTTYLFAWSGTSLAYNTYTVPTASAFRGSIWDRSGRALFYATSGSIIGYEFTKAGGIVSTYTAPSPAIASPPGTSTLRASPTSDRLWWWSSDITGKLCSISYNPVAKTFGTFTQAVYLNNYPSSGDKRSSISPDGNFYGSGVSASGGAVYLYRINSDGTSSGAVPTPTSISSTGGNTYNVAWSPSGAAIGIGLGSGNPRIRIFRWSADTYYGSEYSYANYTTALSTTYKIFWNNAGNVIFFLTSNTIPLVAYRWDDTNGIGAKFADTGGFTWLGGTTADVAISPDDKLLVFNSASTGGGSDVALAWDNTTGFGAVTTMPVGIANQNTVAFGTVTN